MADGVRRLIACLPDLYSARVGSSQLVRSYATTAMGEMRGTTHDNLPSLAFEAFMRNSPIHHDCPSRGRPSVGAFYHAGGI